MTNKYTLRLTVGYNNLRTLPTPRELLRLCRSYKKVYSLFEEPHAVVFRENLGMADLKT